VSLLTSGQDAADRFSDENGGEMLDDPEQEEGQEIQEIMEDALPDKLDDDQIEDEEPREPGLDAV
jgi:hypothetical protein